MYFMNFWIIAKHSSFCLSLKSIFNKNYALFIRIFLSCSNFWCDFYFYVGSIFYADLYYNFRNYSVYISKDYWILHIICIIAQLVNNNGIFYRMHMGLFWNTEISKWSSQEIMSRVILNTNSFKNIKWAYMVYFLGW